MNKYSSYRSEMVSTDGWTDGRTDGRTDRRTDTEGYNIIPRHTLVAGYNYLSGQLVALSKYLEHKSVIIF